VARALGQKQSTSFFAASKACEMAMTTIPSSMQSCKQCTAQLWRDDGDGTLA